MPPVFIDPICSGMSSSCDLLDGMGRSDETPATHKATTIKGEFLLVNGKDAKHQIRYRELHLPEDQQPVNGEEE